MTRSRLAACLALALSVAASGAASPFDGLRPAHEAQAEVVLTRDFESVDLRRAQRLAVATLQDLGFALESADAETGVVTASLLDAHPLRLTISIAAKSESTITASVRTEFAGKPISSSVPAEAFFAAYAAALSPAIEF
jgi:hypothetical protein